MRKADQPKDPGTDPANRKANAPENIVLPGDKEISLRHQSGHRMQFSPKRSANHLTRLQQTVCQAEGSLAGQFAQIQLAAAAGNFDDAKTRLASLYHEYVDECDRNEFLYRNLVQSNVALGQFSCACRLINRHLDCSDTWGFCIDPDSTRPPNTVLWTVRSRAQYCFEFSSNLYLIPHTEMVLNNWLSSLPALMAYRNYDDHKCGQVVVNLGDHGVLPGLAFSDCRIDSFLIPDPQFQSTHAYREIGDSFDRNDIAWLDRRPLAFWRGATTGRYPVAGVQNWLDLPRVRLCTIANSRPDLFDVGLHRIIQIQKEEDILAIEHSGLMRPPVPETDFNQYRYQIDIDGNSNSWAGLFIKLLTGSPVLKISSPMGFRQWYYDLLKPWVHFVPVAADMSDLIEKTEWLRDNPGRAEDIGNRGRSLARTLSYESEIERCSSTLASAFQFFSTGTARR
jgi:hypothetical protein